MTTTNKNENLAILDDAVKLAGSIDGVKVVRSQTEVLISAAGTSKAKRDAGRAAILAAKKQIAAYLLDTYPHRKLNHSKVNGARVWWYYVGNQPEGQRCGIKVVPTDAEMTSIVNGPIKGVNC